MDYTYQPKQSNKRLVAVVAVGVIIAGYIMIRQQKQRERDAQMALAANQQMIESVKKS